MAEAASITEGPAIGIDLGTTYSCAAVVRNGKVEVITNEQGNSTTPSFVAFNGHERMIGDAAKQQMTLNSENTIFDAKRLIGRKFIDPIIQTDAQQWPFKVVDVNGMPKIEVTYKNELKQFSAEEISAMILGKMKEIAEAYLNVPVTNAVVTVPAYFNDMQRKATKDAGTIAGLNVTRIISEPTAAAMAHGLKNDTKTAKNILVYDLGGGTFDVSILNIRENVYEVKATAGDTHLGGEDFDNRMMKMCMDILKTKRKVDISDNNKALRKLRTHCEKAKQRLSSTNHMTIRIDSLCSGIDFQETISRTKFEETCADLFVLTIKIVEGALRDADLKSKDIDTIVLVGGSTRIPKIQQMLQEKFPGKEICKSINAEEAVARGAAILAAIIHGGANEEMDKMKLLEVTPLTLGTTIGDAEEDEESLIMWPMIKRNTPIPVSVSVDYVTVEDNQTVFPVDIIQGERRLAKDNYEIGKFTIEGIPAAPASVEKVTVTFAIDENGILTVSATSHSDPNVSGKLTIKNVCGSLTATEIERMVADAEVYRQQDQEIKKFKTARVDLEEYCVGVKKKYASKKSVVVEKCIEIQSWLSTCSRPTISQFERKKRELKSLILPKAKKREQEDDDVIILPNDDVIIVIDD